MSELFTQNLFTQNNGGGGGTGGAVDSVNGKTGTVVLTGNDLSVSSTNATKVATAVTENGNAIVGLSAELNNLSQVVEGKQDKLTAGEGINIEGNTISSTSQIPDNVYTEDNLVAGNNVTITKVLPEGGIDDNTLACFSLDNTTQNLSNKNYTLNSVLNPTFLQSHSWLENISTAKFDITPSASTNNILLENLSDNDKLVDDFTLDFRAYIPNAKNSEYGSIGLSGGTETLFGWQYGNAWASYGGYKSSSSTAITVTDWYHYAIVRHNYTITFYINGKSIYTANEDVGIRNNLRLRIYGTLIGAQFSNIRLSNTAIWTSDFEPPTKPYSLAIPTGKKQINAIIPEIDLNGYLKKSDAEEKYAPKADTYTKEETDNKISQALVGIDTSKLVTTDTEQTITGKKKFNGEVEVFENQFHVKGTGSNAAADLTFGVTSVPLGHVLKIDGGRGIAALDFYSAYDNKSKAIFDNEKGVADGVASLDENAKVLSEQIPVATASALGGVKVDGTTVTVAEDGTISAVGGGTTTVPTLTWYTGNTGTQVTVNSTASAQLVKVYMNGLLLQPTEDYTLNDTVLTLTTELVAADKITLEVY